MGSAGGFASTCFSLKHILFCGSLLDCLRVSHRLELRGVVSPLLMSSPADTDDATHGAILTDSLRRLQLKERIPSSLVEHTRPTGLTDAHAGDEASARGDQDKDDPQPPSPNHLTSIARLHEGYGFRPPSGIATPVSPSLPTVGTSSPLPDPNGLGWPGKACLICMYNSFAESTLQS